MTKYYQGLFLTCGAPELKSSWKIAHKNFQRFGLPFEPHLLFHPILDGLFDAKLVLVLFSGIGCEISNFLNFDLFLEDLSKKLDTDFSFSLEVDFKRSFVFELASLWLRRLSKDEGLSGLNVFVNGGGSRIKIILRHTCKKYLEVLKRVSEFPIC